MYALVALSHLGGDSVPRLSVTLAIVLVLFDAIAVLYLLASLRHAVTGGGLSRSVGGELRTIIDRVFPPHEDSPLVTVPPGDGPGTCVPVVHRGPPGVVSALDERRLVRLAVRHDLRVHLVCAVGDFVRSGATVAVVPGPEPVPRRLPRRIASCVRYAPSRTVEHDTAYGLRLLADIAIRGLSPAMNDPTTAVQALDQIEDVLLRLAGHPVGPAWLVDGDGAARVSCPAPQWPDFVAVALDETLSYGASNVQTVRRLRALLDAVIDAAPADRRAVVIERRQALGRLADAALTDPFLREVASRPDAQGLGGPNRRDTPSH